GRYNLQEAGTLETALPANPFSPVLKKMEALPGERRVHLEVIVHTHQSTGGTGGAHSDGLPFENQHPEPALRQVVGNACTDHSGANHDGIIGLVHGFSWF